MPRTVTDTVTITHLRSSLCSEAVAERLSENVWERPDFLAWPDWLEGWNVRDIHGEHDTTVTDHVIPQSVSITLEVTTTRGSIYWRNSWFDGDIMNPTLLERITPMLQSWPRWYQRLWPHFSSFLPKFSYQSRPLPWSLWSFSDEMKSKTIRYYIS